MPGSIQVEQRERVLLATIANPPHALMDAAIVGALEKLVGRSESDTDVGAVVLTGAHEQRFLAHYDVSELLAASESGPALGPDAARASLRAAGTLRRLPIAERMLSRTPASGLLELERFGDILLRMERSGAVWIAALNGSALGGGCELALACDFRWMADGDHLIGQPEILLGFPPGGGGTQRLTRMLGTSRALRLVLDGGPLSPAEALEVGVVDQVVAAKGLQEAALAEAARLGSRPKAAVAAAKRAVYEGGSLPLPDGLRRERAEFLSTLAGQEARAAMRAYVEATERSGELPGYDPDARRQALDRGRFA
jgi:enoyl-CoA hydratase/carnithine racemase